MSAVACAIGAALLARPAAATLLDEPPRQLTFKLHDARSVDPIFGGASPLPLLDAFRNAEIERPGPLRLYSGGRWGRWRSEPLWSLSWTPDLEARSEVEPTEEALPRFAEGLFAPPAPIEHELSLVGLASRRLDVDPLRVEPVFASTGPSLKSNGFDALWVPPPKPEPWWKCQRRPVTFVRYGAESAAFDLLGCDGAIAPLALDRLSIVARPPDAPSPGDALPDEPDPEAWARGEWTDGVRLANPRLVWLLQRIADAFPRRTIYVYSGYRPKKESDKKRSHHSLHGDGRAMDVHVMGVPNAELFKVCRGLDDVGCGFYPNSKFVHVDVRRPGTGHAFWIDTSAPGEPSRFVDSWPGVVESGGLAWDTRKSGP